MKCVRSLTTTKVVRISNEEAAWNVSAGLATYCPKHEWKKEGRKYDGKQN